jgi:hypothetical protein
MTGKHRESIQSRPHTSFPYHSAFASIKMCKRTWLEVGRFHVGLKRVTENCKRSSLGCTCRRGPRLAPLNTSHPAPYFGNVTSHTHVRMRSGPSVLAATIGCTATRVSFADRNHFFSGYVTRVYVLPSIHIRHPTPQRHCSRIPTYFPCLLCRYWCFYSSTYCPTRSILLPNRTSIPTLEDALQDRKQLACICLNIVCIRGKPIHRIDNHSLLQWIYIEPRSLGQSCSMLSHYTNPTAPQTQNYQQHHTLIRLIIEAVRHPTETA